MDMRDVNRKVIEQFRAGGSLEGGMHRERLVLLSTVGRRTGERRTAPMLVVPDGDRLLVIASNAGATEHPNWYLNVIADPHVGVEIADDAYDALATTIEGEERERLWAMLKERYPFFKKHEATAGRTIPVVSLRRA